MQNKYLLVGKKRLFLMERYKFFKIQAYNFHVRYLRTVLNVKTIMKMLSTMIFALVLP